MIRLICFTKTIVANLDLKQIAPKTKKLNKNIRVINKKKNFH